MKTVLIFDETTDNLRFAVIDGDYSRLDMVYINTSSDQDLIDELCDIVFDEVGRYKLRFSEEFPLDIVKSEEVKVIVCGFVA